MLEAEGLNGDVIGLVGRERLELGGSGRRLKLKKVGKSDGIFVLR